MTIDAVVLKRQANRHPSRALTVLRPSKWEGTPPNHEPITCMVVVSYNYGHPVSFAEILENLPAGYGVYINAEKQFWGFKKVD
jgi:hypothetical protein